MASLARASKRTSLRTRRSSRSAAGISAAAGFLVALICASFMIRFRQPYLGRRRCLLRVDNASWPPEH